MYHVDVRRFGPQDLSGSIPGSLQDRPKRIKVRNVHIEDLSLPLRQMCLYGVSNRSADRTHGSVI